MGCHPQRLRHVRAKPRARSCTWVRAIPTLKRSCEMKGEITATCACYRESQTYPGLHPQKCGQQIEGGDPAPPLCTDETTDDTVIQMWNPQYRRKMDIQKKGTKIIQGMKCFLYEERLRELRLFIL